MSQRNLDALLAPRSVAVIGAGRQPGSVGQVVLRNIAATFKGPLAVVHPTASDIAGVPAAPSVAALPFTPDVGVIATPPDAVPDTIAALGRKGARAAIVITAGFGEGQDSRGHERRAAMLSAAKPHLLRILGPNCLGLIAPTLGFNASFAPQRVAPGSLALISQSGAIAVSLLDWATGRGVGFSTVASLGDMADVDFGDLLDWLAMDEHTAAILLYIEAVTSPRKFMSALRAAARLKPVVVVKGGRHAEGARAAASHTGALAGADDVYDAAFARAGAMRVESLPELFSVAELLAAARLPTGDRLAVVTNGGGLGVLAADAIAAQGGRLAQLSVATIASLNEALPATWSRGNPVDIIGDADGPRFERALDRVLADAAVDAALVLYCPTAVSDPDDAARATIATAARHLKPVLTGWVGEGTVGTARAAFTKARLPTFATPEDAVRAFGRLDTFRKRRAALMETPPPAPMPKPADRNRVAHLVADAGSGGWLGGQQAKDAAAAYGIPVNRSRFAPSPSDAAGIAREIGGRLALKIVSPDIIHKSDVGGVALNLDTPAAVEIAAAAMLERAAKLRPTATITGFLVEEMISRPRAHELFLGMTVDPTFGPVIAFGHGGTAVEVIADKSIGLPPLNLTLARGMIESTKIGRLLKGYRDRPAADIDAIAAAIVALSALTVDHAAITDIDINPLLADDAGIIAVDARFRASKGERANLVIAPYPAQLARPITSRNGAALIARPIRPEDESALRRFVSQLSPEDVRFRFFLPLRQIDHPLAARLTQIDYDREMAFVAAPVAAPEEFWGVVRLHADPDNLRAEYAVTVRSDKKGLGLGTALMTLALDEARRRGIGEIWGDVLADNARMLNLAKDMGFTPVSVANDATVVRTVKRL